MDLDKLITATTDAERSDLAREIVDGFCSDDHSLEPDEIDLLVHVFVGVFGGLDADTRLALSFKMAESTSVPREVIQAIACSQIQTARWLLRRSPQLDDDMLVGIIEATGAEHAYTIAQRPTVSARISETLLANANESIALALTDNPGAQISIQGFGQLAKIARRSQIVEEALCGRDDLPGEIESKITKIVRMRMESELGSIANHLPDDQIRAVMQTKDIETPSESTSAIAIPVSAYTEIENFRVRGQLNEGKLLELLAEGKLTHAICTFAHLAKLKTMIARRVVLSPFGPSLALAARAAPLELATYRALVESFAEYIRALDNEIVEQLCSTYENRSIRDARSIMELHRRRRSY